MTDRIVLTNMRFDARHGYHEWERRQMQPFEVDVELVRDLRSAGQTDDLERTIDYGAVYNTVRAILDGPPIRLLEAIAERISDRILTDFDVAEVVVRVRKPGVQLGGPLDHASVEIHRTRP
jgi:dihydroneopterin aldolase